MIEPNLALALAVHHTPRAYALLLGSGISRTAGIPTGWEIVLKLIRRLAALQRADCEPDPAAWYNETYHEAPDYARLLNQLANTQTARQQILRPYFEPSAEEREEGTKLPTPAHRAIAQLVASKAIKIIVTTNFDELLEQAIKDAGVTPTVISTTDTLAGALPPGLVDCAIIKLHGSYTDVRIKNTPDELATYDTAMNTLLDRVFDEYGLIVCGWSAEWDTALRDALRRCPSHRFSTFWMAKDGIVGSQAQQLIDHRRALVVPITGADKAFEDLNEQVAALAEQDRPHPLSKTIAVARFETYLVDEQHRIRRHHFLMDECERVRAALYGPSFTSGPSNLTTPSARANELQRRITRYEQFTDTLRALLVTGCYWGTEAHHDLWVQCLEYIATIPPTTGTSFDLWRDLQRYPALLLLYAGASHHLQRNVTIPLRSFSHAQ